MNKKTDLKNLTLEEMTDFVLAMGEKKFRAAQIFRKMYAGAESFDEMKELPAAFREKLKESARLGLVDMKQRQISVDGTRKYLFAIDGGEAVESVYMQYHYGGTVCVSCQAGCRMGCAFCASGINGLTRNLTAGEIVDQILSVQRDVGEKITHVVFMGTGEPLDNYEQVSKALRLLNDPRGFGLGARHVTVSTCGLTGKMENFARDFPQTGLAVSLHAPSDEIRRQIMPVAKSVSMEELLAASRKYTETTHRRITFEYALIEGVNDRAEHARMLASGLKGMLCHVNLIPLNTVEENHFRSARREQAEAFARILEKQGVQATIRRSLGPDIQAACGQLRLAEGNRTSDTEEKGLQQK